MKRLGGGWRAAWLLAGLTGVWLGTGSPAVLSLPAGPTEGADISAAAPASAPPTGATAATAADRDALAVQRARTEHGKGIKDKKFYTHPWNLDSLPPYTPERQVTGPIRIWGNDVLTRGRLLEYWTAGFHRFQPGAVLDFHLASSAVALPSLVTGVADIGIGRHIMFMEQLGFERTYGYAPLEVEALNGAYDVLGWNPAWVIVLNHHNPLSRLTVQQLDGIFGAERNGGWVGTTWHPEFARGPEQNIRTWGQLGLTGAWRDRPIHVYSMPFQYDPSNTFDRLVIQGSDKWNERIQQFPQYVGPDGKLVIGAQVLVGEIGHDPLGIGWSALGYVTPATKAVAIALTSHDPFIAPTIEHVQDRSYYFHNTNYFYLNRRPGQPLDPKVREFLRYVLSREGQADVVRDGKILPLTGAVVQEQLAKLN
jgi:phosphate transport system substrate-binding protein